MTGETLTKFILNNKIVEMRKNVRQSRVHCINKLTKEIRKLKNKKGNEEQIGKNLKKVDKLIEQLAVMKKVNPDVVSKFALQNEKSLIEITNDVNEAIENKAIARLACYKLVHQEVMEFRKKFPDWKKSLVFLLESLGEKYKNKKQNKSVVSNKKEKIFNLPRKNVASNDEEKSKTSNVSQSTKIRSSSGLWTVKSYESIDRHDEDNFTIDDNSPEDISNSNNLSDENFNFKREEIVAEATNSNLDVKKLHVPVRNFKTEASIERIPQDNITKTQFNFSPSNYIEDNKNSVNIPCINVPEVGADSFFVTVDNKEYLSISARQICDKEESHIHRKAKERIKPQTKFAGFHTKHNQLKSKFNQQNGGIVKTNFAKHESFDLTRQKPSSVKDVPSVSSLHPSWEAKKKLTTIIQNSQFQGKKIKFDE